MSAAELEQALNEHPHPTPVDFDAVQIVDGEEFTDDLEALSEAIHDAEEQQEENY